MISGLDGSVLLSVAAPGGETNFPSSLARPRDLNGDGVLDLLIGSVGAASGNGSLYAISGATAAPLWRLDGGPSEGLGRNVVSVDDMDGDDVPDVVVSSWNGIALTYDFPGYIRVVSGATGVVLAGREGAVPYQGLGFSLASVMDRNGDGVRDIATRRASPFTERAVVFLSGTDLAPLGEIRPPASISSFVSSLDGGGDFDGDGVEDLLVGSPYNLQVYSGRSDRLIAHVQNASQFYGRHVRYIGDLDRDGLPEVAAGDHFRDPGQLLIYESTPGNGAVLCVGRPNANGPRGWLFADSPSGYDLATGDLSLRARGLPPGAFGLFLAGDGTDRIVEFGGSRGTLCIGGGAFGRFIDDVVVADAMGTVVFSPDLNAIPWTAGGTFGIRAAVPGETLGFQLWYRDVLAGGSASSNFTDAVTVTFR